MILTCPECATSYFVDDSRIPAAGRSVKCTSCGARWKAGRESPTPEPEPEAVAAAPPAPEAAEAAEAAEASPAAKPAPLDDDLEIVAAEPEPEPEPEPVRRKPSRSAASPRGDANATAFVWAAAAVAVVALVASAILFRSQVVRLWPKSQVAYAGIGLPVESLGLVIEAVHVEPAFQAGRPVLAITGSIRNVKDTAVEAPPLRISLLGRGGQPIAAKVARPLDAHIPAKALRHFAIAITDPPANARDLEVTFEGETGERAAAVAAHVPAQPAIPPTDAQPLPPGTPESLTEHG